MIKVISYLNHDGNDNTVGGNSNRNGDTDIIMIM